MSLARRSFLTGIGAIVCAPAIVRASSLMPIKVVREIKPELGLVYRMKIIMPDFLPGTMGSGWEPFDVSTMAPGQQELVKLGEHGVPQIVTRLAPSLNRTTQLP